ncbi:MAG: 1-(5-phosphoribosyl)-5-[(5-phosphoribosylamino)methylideneamino]imidazole-4-carboxamide isomerase [Nitrospirae bacterium]|nr:1-(5-phosphoribosyl)-5-[(5-phosphoribosylamino)methylideneamino]imidazole-4-carboxamide isomerase [Nitrospirota bacterium]
MIVIPAIDLKEGFCVRLLQGRKEEATTYSNDPVETARRWVSAGAELIHIVDLDGAFTGEQKNIRSIERIREAVGVRLEVGGGIRGMDRIDHLAGLGIDRMIIGTLAIENPQFFCEACRKYPGRILAGIDAKNGRVAIKGWEEITERTALSFALEMEHLGAAGIIYTDISKDGMLVGPNVEATAEIAGVVGIPVIASGGVSTLGDIERLKAVGGLYGVITGKAIYSGSIDLREAIALAAV